MADSKAAKLGSIATRLVPPLLILALGWFGYATLSLEPEEKKKVRGKARPIKTQVIELMVQDYPTTIETQGNVRPHDQITLNSEVAGRIVRISSSFEDGAFFTKGELLLELDTADFKAALTTAEAQIARTTASHALEQAQANQARESWEKLALDEDPDPLVLRIPQLRQAEANMKSATAQYERARRDLERTQIRAPFYGRVRQRTVGIGQSIRTSTGLGTIFASDYAEVRLPISGIDLPLLDLPEVVGDPSVHVELRDTLNPESDTVWEASIIRTEGALDPDTLELFAIAKVDDPFGLKTGKPPLRIGQPVTATVSGKILRDVMALPRIAVKKLDQIYLIDQTRLTLHRRTIKPIWADARHIIIRDPEIADGSLVATNRLSYAPDGARVEILPDINPEAPTETTMLNERRSSKGAAVGK